MRYVAILAALSLLSVCISGCTGTSQPTTEEIKSSISTGLKNGTVVLFFRQDNCPECVKAEPKIADLKTEYSGKNVTFLTISVDQSSAKPIGQTYAVYSTPTTIVLYQNGTEAKKLLGDFEKDTLKTAIDSALNASVVKVTRTSTAKVTRTSTAKIQ